MRRGWRATMSKISIVLLGATLLAVAGLPGAGAQTDDPATLLPVCVHREGVVNVDTCLPDDYCTGGRCAEVDARWNEENLRVEVFALNGHMWFASVDPFPAPEPVRPVILEVIWYEDGHASLEIVVDGLWVQS